jgi:hypothetical protein
MPTPNLHHHLQKLLPRKGLRLNWWALEFHEVAMRWVPPVAGQRTLRSQLERSSFRAFLCIGQAARSVDARAKSLLDKARMALDTSLATLEALRAQGRLQPSELDEALARVEKMLVEIDKLDLIPVERWLTCPEHLIENLNPITDEMSDVTGSSPLVRSMRRAWRDRLAAEALQFVDASQPPLVSNSNSELTADLPAAVVDDESFAPGLLVAEAES